MKSPDTLAALILLCLAMVSCAPAYRARLDTAASAGIIWPGAPEKPRISYLWSLRDLSETPSGGTDKVLSGIAGGAAEDDEAPDTFRSPQGVFVDARRYYVADPGAARVTVIDRGSMDVLHITDGAGGEPLIFPRAVVADAAGTIYVSDSEQKKVLIYRPDGSYASALEGDFKRPAGLALDGVRSILYVADTDAQTICVYGTDGKRRGTIGERGTGPGQFRYPTYITVDREGNLFVTDLLNFRVQKFSPEGKFLLSIGSLGDSYDTLDKPKGVAVDSEGHVYIVDGARHMVKIFDQQGRLLLFFGEKGGRYGDFYLPAGIFIDDKNVIYVTDTLNMRVQAFQFLGGN